MVRVSRFSLLATVVIAAAPAARADWPAAHHDARRTGQASSPANLTTPAPYWRHYLGGVFDPTMAMPVGTDDVAYIGAGRLQVLSAQGVPRWRSENLGLVKLVALADLDGDGTDELIVRSSSQVFVFDPTTGARLWDEPAGEMGTIGDVRVTDLDGRGGLELAIQECYCCQIQNLTTPGIIYRFDSGWATPTRVWTLPSSACAGSRQMQFADVTGDAAPDFVLSTHTEIKLLDGRTGAALATTGDLGPWASIAYCQAEDVLPGAGAELVCWLASPLANPGTGHRVFVLAYRTGPARLDVVWSTDVGARDVDAIMGATRIGDLDHDGARELIATGVNAAGEPLVAVLDLTTGEVLATITGQQQVGIITPTATDGFVVTQADQQLIGWRFDRAATPRMTLAWRLKDRRALTTIDPALAARTPLATELVMLDVNGDGALDLVTVDTKRPNEVDVYDARNPADSTLATWQAAAGSTVTAGWLAGGRLVVAATDGTLASLDTPSLTLRGRFRAGQYYDAGGYGHFPIAPLAAQLTGDAAAEVVVTDSRQTLAALDARGATNAAPPQTLWELRSTLGAALSGDLGGTPGLMCRRIDGNTVPPTEKVARVDGTGAIRWETALPGPAWNDVVLGNFDGDGVPDVAVQWGLPTDVAIRTTALAGRDGAELWTTGTNTGPAKFPSGLTVADWNRDGRDDVILHHYGTRIFDGASGAIIAAATSTPPTAYMGALVANLDADSDDELVLSGGFSAARALDHDLTSMWTGADDRPYPYAALVTCGGRSLVITGSLTPGLVKVIDPVAAQQVRSLVLAGGRRFPDAAAATAAGATPGLLASSVVHTNLTGAGHASAVVGSSDGWLYAYDPCSDTALDFAVPFDAPVGATALADTDGDGADELLVSVADGYLYGLKHAPLAGPGEVRDLVPGATAGPDVDEVDTLDTLSAAWAPVPGADSYEVAIAHADGGFAAYPPWQPVTGTSMTRSGIDLVDGERYVIAVRAVSAAGRSPDILSDGVLVHKGGAPGADAGVDAGGPPTPGGGCCSTGGDPLAGLGLGGVVLGLVARRRRRASA
ncbi:MAG: VCBS repeat-containing protein [Kofleriaceae bacterium]